jgi:alkaline phosphatase D
VFWPGLNLFNVDAWDGYQAARDRLMRFLGTNEIQNAIVLTGDIHSSWAADLKMDFTDGGSPIVGAEFVCSSITSTFGDGNVPLVRFTLPSNPHIKFFDGLHRGYALCTVTPDQWRTDFRAVTRPAVPSSVFTVPSADLPVFTLGSYAVNSGEPGVKKLL